MAALLLIALALASAAQRNVTIETLPDNRFRVSTEIASSADYELITRALLRLRAAAEEQCRGRAAPVSIGGMESNQSPTRRNRSVLAEVYACGRPAE